MTHLLRFWNWLKYTVIADPETNAYCCRVDEEWEREGR